VAWVWFGRASSVRVIVSSMLILTGVSSVLWSAFSLGKESPGMNHVAQAASALKLWVEDWPIWWRELSLLGNGCRSPDLAYWGALNSWEDCGAITSI